MSYTPLGESGEIVLGETAVNGEFRREVLLFQGVGPLSPILF